MEIHKKLSVLKKVAKILNDHHITYAVGASLVLYFKGIVTDFNDIDIFIDEKDTADVKKLFSELGILKPERANTGYKTKEFMEYVIEGVELDVIAGFIIVANNSEHYFPLKKENIKENIDLEGITIPIQSVEEWKLFYSLMGRTEKVKLIEKS